MALVCIGDQKQDVIRTIYTTAEDAVLIADPVTYLLAADSVQQPNADTFLIKSQTSIGEESLTINNSGTAVLALKANNKTENINMNCYSNGLNNNFSMPNLSIKK